MKIVIVGGGITGWLSALVFSNKQPNHQYVIIESPDVNTIGVGEGTTGLFNETIFKFPSVNPQEFLRETKATPKIGIEFNNWSKKGSTFFNPLDGTLTGTQNFDSYIYYTYIKNNSLDTSSLHGFIKRNNKTPFYTEGGYLRAYNTAVHLDNNLTIQYLKKKTLGNNNIAFISDTVTKIKRDETGKVKKIICKKNNVNGDIFIDCTGYKRIFSEDSDWISFKDNLPMNSVTTFVRKHSGNVDCVTKATALSSGWCWEIPTQERVGCGYVHCDRFINQEDVEKEIKLNYPDAKIKKSFKFDSGKLKKSWNHNVISLGLAYHFLEPLQATNIHLTIVQLNVLCEKYLRNSPDKTLNMHMISSYNRHIDSLIENYRNFINIHYSGKRCDTDFWKQISTGKHLTDFSKEIIGILKVRGLFYNDLPLMLGGTGVGLWGHTLLGLNLISEDDCVSFLSEDNYLNMARDADLRMKGMQSQIKFLSYKELIDIL